MGPTLERLGMDAATARIAAGIFDRFAGSVAQGGDMLAGMDAAERVAVRVDWLSPWSRWRRGGNAESSSPNR